MTKEQCISELVSSLTDLVWLVEEGELKFEENTNSPYYYLIIKAKEALNTYEESNIR